MWLQVQTESIIMKESGMHHTEGGWPKEINPRDEEAIARYRRRVEKEDNWASKMHNLMKPMERYILQNNAINIYEQYFSDIIPPKIVSPSVRTVNIYKDLQETVRPIIHLSWSSDNGRHLVGAYCSVESLKVSDNLSVYSYIWDIENPNKPLMELEACHPLVTIEFNPRDPSLLISGLMSGQVCNWDIRSGNTPIMTSHTQFSHKHPANCALWINSKTNSEFFSASIEGTIHWWDIRMLEKPVESLIVDLVDPLQGDVVRATGVSSLQYETTMGTKFIAGLENGLIINATRKAKNTAEKMANRLECHYGPVIAVDRNPFSLKNFLTIGDWSTKIWAEDTKEGSLISTRQHKSILTGGCWSTSRCSVFYVINYEGTMEIFDILLGLKTPVTTTRLCRGSLQAIAPHVNGKLVAVGSERGKIYLVESSDALTTTSPNDKNHMAAFFEQCSRFEKAVDSRMKETRLAQRIIYEKSESSMRSPRAIIKNQNPTCKQDKDKRSNDKKRPEREKREMRQKKSKDVWALLGDSELADIEREYFQAIEKEMERYADTVAVHREILEGSASTSTIKEASNKRGKYDDPKIDKTVGRKTDSQKQRVFKESTGKDKNERAFKTKDIVIVKKKYGTSIHGKDDGDKIKDWTKATGQTEIIEERVMMKEKVDERKNNKDGNNEIFEASQSIENKRRWKIGKNLSQSIEKQISVGNLCDDGICAPEVCCRDQTDSSIYLEDDQETNSSINNYEKKKMTLLIEEMIAGLPNNILPFQLEHSPRYTKEEKKAILRENDSPPTLLRKALKDGRKEKQQMENKVINVRRHADTKCSTKIPVVINKSDEITNELKVIPRALSSNSITAGKLESSTEISKLNKRIGMSKISDKSESYTDDCEPIVSRFNTQEILGAVGAKTAVSRPSAQTSTLKSNVISRKPKNYPRISAVQINKQA